MEMFMNQLKCVTLKSICFYKTAANCASFCMREPSECPHILSFLYHILWINFGRKYWIMLKQTLNLLGLGFAYNLMQNFLTGLETPMFCFLIIPCWGRPTFHPVSFVPRNPTDLQMPMQPLPELTDWHRSLRAFANGERNRKRDCRSWVGIKTFAQKLSWSSNIIILM